MKKHIAEKGHIVKDPITKGPITIKNNDTMKNHIASSVLPEQNQPPEPPNKSSKSSPEPPEPQHLSKYSFMRESYLKDHQPETYKQMIQSGELRSHCLEVQQQAKSRLDFMMKQMVEHNPPPSRNDDGLAWAAHMNMLKHSVEEVIFDELIHV